MSEISTAAAALTAVVSGIRPEQLTDPTPCTEFDVRALLGHLAEWAPSLAGAGRKQTVEPSAVDGDDPRSVLLERVSDLVEAWDTPGSHEGTTHLGGPTEMPAALVADMVLGELVVHGWDLARATGRPFDLPEDLLKRLHDGVLATAAEARAMGVYGPEVPVPSSASTMDRLLGLTGRNPAWAG